MRAAIKAAWAGWKRVAHAIGDAQARILLGLFYFVLLAPCALVVRMAGRDAPGGWRPVPAAAGPEHERALRQF